VRSSPDIEETSTSGLFLVTASHRSRQQQYDHNHQHQSKAAARVIAPRSAVRPGWQGAQQCQNQDYEQYCKHHVLQSVLIKQTTGPSWFVRTGPLSPSSCYLQHHLMLVAGRIGFPSLTGVFFDRCQERFGGFRRARFAVQDVGEGYRAAVEHTSLIFVL
jgi:hypothetical protein